MHAEASGHVRPLMKTLDELDKRFLARKKLSCTPGPDGPFPVIHWLLSDALMEQINGAPSDDDVVRAGVEAARKLIAARYLVAENSGRQWDFTWDESEERGPWE
jgi:hypothetical protein